MKFYAYALAGTNTLGKNTLLVSLPNNSPLFQSTFVFLLLGTSLRTRHWRTSWWQPTESLERDTMCFLGGWRYNRNLSSGLRRILNKLSCWSIRWFALEALLELVSIHLCDLLLVSNLVEQQHVCSLLLDFIPGIFRAIFESLILLTFRVCIPICLPRRSRLAISQTEKKQNKKKTKTKTKTKKASGNFCKKNSNGCEIDYWCFGPLSWKLPALQKDLL